MTQLTLNGYQVALLAVLPKSAAGKPALTAATLASLMRLPLDLVERELQELVAAGLMVRHETTASAVYSVKEYEHAN